MLVYGSYIQVPNLGVTLFGGYCEAHLFSVPNDCLWYDKLWGPSQRVVTLLSSRTGAYGRPRLPGDLANAGQQQVGELKSNKCEAARAGQLGGREQQEGGEAEQGEEGDHRGLGDPHRRHLHRAENRGWILWSASAPTFLHEI